MQLMPVWPVMCRRSCELACLAFLGALTGSTACAAEPPAPATAPAAAPGAPGQALRHFTLKIDGQTLQLDAQSLDIDAQSIEAGGKAQTFRGNVRLQLQLSRSPAAAGAGQATPGRVTLILQADALELTQPPLHIRVKPGSACRVTLQDPSGRQLWKLAGTQCSLLE